MSGDRPTRRALARRIDAAMGRIACDLVLRDVRYLDVFSATFREGDVGVIDGTIVALEPGLTATRVVEGQGRVLVPGFIDAHVHIESSLLVPDAFERTVLPKGTTTVIADPHEIANVMGVAGIRYFLEAADQAALDLRVMLSSCVPATDFETNGAGHLEAADLVPFASHPRVLGLAELMNFPGLLANDEAVLEKVAQFSTMPIDGHCPMLRGRGLSAYAAAGISSCHESSQLDEAAEKLTKGLAVWIREGSVAKDLDALVPLLSLATSTSIGFCTDDRNPLDIADEGHLDHLLRRAIARGVPPEVAYRSASWSVARHYGLAGVGAIAPGHRADFVLLEDASTCAVSRVWRGGVAVDELDFASRRARQDASSVRATVPLATELEAPTGSVRVIGVVPGKLLTTHEVRAHDAPGVKRLSVLERHGHGRAPANGYVLGFGAGLSGAIASSVGHDSHNLIVVGDSTADMQTALAALIGSGGGFVVVKNGAVLAQLALPIAGLMSVEEPGVVAARLRELRSASRAIGCELAEPFLQLAFLSLPVIPSLKLTDRGLVDVERFELVPVRAA